MCRWATAGARRRLSILATVKLPDVEMSKLWRRVLEKWRHYEARLSAAFALTTLALTVVTVVQARMLLTRGWSVPLGNVAEWVAGVGALAAFGALFYAAREWRTAQEERRERVKVERRAQADLISAWVQGEDTCDSQKYAIIGLSNASYGVVYDLQVHVTCGPLSQSPNDIYRMMELRAFGYLRELPPGTWAVRLQLGDICMTTETLDFHFCDQKSVEWTRDSRGSLTETLEKPFALPPSGPWRWQAAELSEWQKDQVLRRSSLTYVPIQVLERSALAS